MNNKGLSPIIAAVILIAATMSIAGILAFWTTGFVKTQLTETAGITGGAECLGAEFELKPGSRLDGTTLNLILDNRRSVDLIITNVYLVNDDNSVDSHPFNNITLEGNEIKLLTVTGVKPNFLTGEIKTHCSDVSVFFTHDQVA